MAVEVLADELMLYRFGGKLVNGTYHLKLNPDEFAVHRPQAVENARRILEENRLAPQPSSNEEKLRELEDPEFWARFKAQLPPKVRPSTINCIVAARAALREQTPCPTCDDTGWVCAGCALPRARCSCGSNGTSENGCPQGCAAQKRLAGEETP